MSSPVTPVTADRAAAATALLIAALTVSACSPGPTASPSAAAGAASPSRIAATTPPAATPAVAFDGLPVFVDVPNYKGDDARTGVMAGPGPVAAPSEAWHVHVPCSITDHTPVLATGLLLIGCDAPTLYALYARTGATRGTATLDGSLQGSLGVEDGTVYAARRRPEPEGLRPAHPRPAHGPLTSIPSGTRASSTDALRRDHHRPRPRAGPRDGRAAVVLAGSRGGSTR